MLLSIPESEVYERQKVFNDRLNENGIDGVVLFSPVDIFYLTNFFFSPTERPIALIVDPNGKSYLFVPYLEVDHAEEHALVDKVSSYPEYPGIKHPMEYLKQLLKDIGFENKQVGYDSPGYGSPAGYRGPKIDKLINAKSFISVQDIVPEMRAIKSQNEIELIKESCRWGNLAHRLLQKYSAVGISELEIENKASAEATMAMIETLGEDYKPHGEKAFALFRGQVGKVSAFPHSVSQNAHLKKGDNLVTASSAAIWGYRSELERTMFVNEANKDQRKYFEYMYQSQEVAFDHIKPGNPLSSVERAVQDYYKENNIEHLTRHHTGHAIGLLFHESPFFDLGDETIMQPGMVFTVEPGIYVPEVGGFRHSDTILVTEDGMEMLTYYPRDIDSLICT